MKTEETDYQKQFEAAVHVIQSLPKNGSYRPSYEEMLRFYSYYKQATLGQCQIPRPGFWDPIGKYKWDAWNGLGKMTKEEAMVAYIMEMKTVAKKVINTLPMDKASEDMFVYFEPLYEVIHDMPRPPESFFKKKSVHLDSETASCQKSSLNGLAKTCPNPPAYEKCKHAGPVPADKLTKGSRMTSSSANEVFCDSLKQVEPNQVALFFGCGAIKENQVQARRPPAKQSTPLCLPPRSQAAEKKRDLPITQTQITSTPEVIRESQAGARTQQDIAPQVMSTIQALQQDMKEVMERLSYLESLTALQCHTSTLNPCLPAKGRNGKELPCWPVSLSPHTCFFLLTWPFVVQWLLWCCQRQKK